MIYLTGDTHREEDVSKINPRDGFPIGNTLTSDDYLIICGDFGFIWDDGSGDAFWLNWLESLPWQTCFIDGNHENFDLLNAFPCEEWHGGTVHRIRSNIIHLMRGEIYNIEGHSFFTFGGAFSHDYALRVEKVNWWKEELPTIQEADHALKNLEAANWQVDYILTHDVYSSHPLSKEHDVSLDPYGQGYAHIHDVLEKVYQNTTYSYWYHGHYHVDGEFADKCLCLFDNVVPLKEKRISSK